MILLNKRYVDEGLKQAEFDFDAPDFSAVKSVLGGVLDNFASCCYPVKVMATFGQLERTDLNGGSAISTGVENGSMFVNCRFVMVDPGINDFSNRHAPFLESVKNALPRDFKCEYDNGKHIPSNHRIGNKRQIGYWSDVETGPYGREITDYYDVVETLWIYRA